MLVGQLILPGESSRGDLELRADLRAWIAAPDGEVRQVWIFPDATGRFVWELPGPLTRVSLFAGSEVHRIDAVDFPLADAQGTVDLGPIEMRERVVPWRVRIRDARAAGEGAVRIGRWIGPPHRGPLGELPSLG